MGRIEELEESEKKAKGAAGSAAASASTKNTIPQAGAEWIPNTTGRQPGGASQGPSSTTSRGRSTDQFVSAKREGGALAPTPAANGPDANGGIAIAENISNRRHLQMGGSDFKAVLYGCVELADGYSTTPSYNGMQAAIEAAFSGDNLRSWLAKANDGGIEATGVTTLDEEGNVIGSTA